MPNRRVIISFVAPEHSGKTILEAAFAKILTEHGISVVLPPDPQRDAKMALSLAELLSSFRGKGASVLFMESNAT
jgi:uroporphyrinogen-III synthase